LESTVESIKAGVNETLRSSGNEVESRSRSWRDVDSTNWIKREERRIVERTRKGTMAND
jgi:hypothetical protein